MFRWLRRWLARTLTAAPLLRPALPPPAKPRYRPGMESLEYRTTPAPLMPAAAMPAEASLNADLVFASGAPAADRSDAGPSSFGGEFTASEFGPAIVNSLDRSLFHLEAAATVGESAGMAFFANLDFDLIRDPNLAANVAQGVSISEVYADVSPWSNVGQLVEAVPSPVASSSARQHATVDSIMPLALRNQGQPYSMPSSGSAVALVAASVADAPLGGAHVNFPATSSGITATVTGTVYRDQNGNGIQDTGELPMTGVTVVLEAQHATGYQPVASTVTDPNGRYTFYDDRVGNYRIRPEAPAGFRLTRKLRPISLPVRTPAAPQDFGLAPMHARESNQALPALEPRKAAVDGPESILDNIFAAWNGANVVNNSLLDEAFADVASASRFADDMVPASSRSSDEFEGPKRREAKNEREVAAAALLVGVAAMVHEGERIRVADRYWEDYAISSAEQD